MDRQELHEHHESAQVVRAAGAVLWREVDGVRHIAVIHRPKYDDWSLPKGKLDAGEDDLAGALREVREETGQRAEPGRELSRVTYRDARGRLKVVRYWEMRALGGDFQPGDEVDQLRWLEPQEAMALLSYPHDRHLVHRFLTGT